MAVVTPAFHAAWLSGNHIAGAQPVQKVWIRQGHFDHAYGPWDGPAIAARISADEHVGAVPENDFITGLLDGATTIALDDSNIFWTTFAGAVGRATLDGAGVDQTFISAIPSSVTVSDVKVNGSYVYWSYWSYLTGGAIGRANLDGTGITQAFISSGDGALSFAINATHLYWVNNGDFKIGRANLDGTGVNTSFITADAFVEVIALNGSHIYWTNDDGNVGRANLDGTGVSQSLITGGDEPTSIKLDATYVYWLNEGNGTIGRALLNGSGDNQSFISGANFDFGSSIAINETSIFWSNTPDGTIGRADIDGANVDQSFVTGTLSPTYLILDSTYLYWVQYNEQKIGRMRMSGDEFWQATWTVDTSWVEVPGIFETTIEQSLDNNGIASATIAIENILYNEETGPGGLFHAIERGGLAPFRGYTAPDRDEIQETNTWAQLFAKKAQLKIEQGYGPDNITKVFTCLIDDSDLSPRPARITVTARDFGGHTLADQRFFGNVKDPQIRQPVTFCDPFAADDLFPRGHDASAESSTGVHTPGKVLDTDSGTYWESGIFDDSTDETWVQALVPQGRYASFFLWPKFASMDAKLSIYVEERDDDRDCQFNGVAIPFGEWLNLTGIRDVPIPVSGGSAEAVEGFLVKDDSGTISSTQVGVWIEHPNVGDLSIQLIHPDGTIIALAPDSGWVSSTWKDSTANDLGSGTSTLLVFDDDAGSSIDQNFSSGPVTGSYQPIEALSGLNGKTKNGMWKLNVWDNEDLNSGTIKAVAIGFDGSAPSYGLGGITDGIPYIGSYDDLAVEGNHHLLGSAVDYPQPNEVKIGPESIFRLHWTDLHSLGGGDYVAGVTRFVAMERIRQATARRNHWILVDDVSDAVREILRWAGFKEWEVEDTGVRLKKPYVVSAGDFLIDVIRALAESVGFVFFMKDPTDDDESIGVPVFRSSRVTTDDAATVELSDETTASVAVTDQDLLLGLQVKWNSEPLAYIIRVRGREDKDDGAVLIGFGTGTRRIQYTYRPPWARADANDRTAAIFKHVVHTDNLYTTLDDCQYGALLIALREALASLPGTIELPAHPGIQLDSFADLIDETTGMNTRMWVSGRHVTMHTGPQGNWKMSLDGSMVDTPDVVMVKDEINDLVRGEE